MSSKTKSKSLIITAHPDDESLFFGGLVASVKDVDFELLCMTSGKTEGRAGERTQELEEAGKRLGLHSIYHGLLEDLPDQRLNIDKGLEIINRVVGAKSYERVYTHGVLGEYGHPHHQDVCYMTHKFFENLIPVMSVAFNIPADMHVILNREQFETKAKVVAETYNLESRRFYNLLPISHTEGFSQVSIEEVTELYRFLKGESELNDSLIDYHQSILPLLKSSPLSELVENFFKAYFKASN